MNENDNTNGRKVKVAKRHFFYDKYWFQRKIPVTKRYFYSCELYKYNSYLESIHFPNGKGFSFFPKFWENVLDKEDYYDIMQSKTT